MGDPRQASNCEFAVGHIDRFAPAALAHTIDGGTFEHVQLAPGAFDGRLLRICRGERVLDQGRYNLPVLARGNLSDRRVTLGYAALSEGMVNGKVVGEPFVFLYTESSELDVRLPAWGRWTAAQFSREELDALGVPVPRHHAGVVPTAMAGIGQIARTLAEWDPLLANQGHAPQGAEASVGALFEQLDLAFAGALSTGEGEVLACAGAHYRLVRAARDFIEANLGQPLRVSELCRASGVSYKTLERHFARQLGVSPRRYLALARLARARAMLQSAQHGALRVADVAMQCGLTHFGRFSVEYRRHYGESPAQTRVVRDDRVCPGQPSSPCGMTAAHNSSSASRK